MCRGAPSYLDNEDKLFRELHLPMNALMADVALALLDEDSNADREAQAKRGRPAGGVSEDGDPHLLDEGGGRAMTVHKAFDHTVKVMRRQVLQ